MNDAPAGHASAVAHGLIDSPVEVSDDEAAGRIDPETADSSSHADGEPTAAANHA